MEDFQDIDEDPTPTGELMTRTLVMPSDTNPYGDVYGGWLMKQMDLAGSIKASNIANGRVTTVAAGDMVFLHPVPLGSTVCCYAEIEEVGRSSVRIIVDVWLKTPGAKEKSKLSECSFVYVAIDDHGCTRAINNS